MESFTTEVFVGTLALVGAVILIAALLSGLIERTGLPQVAVLLGLGAALGPFGLGLLDITLDSPILRIVATLSLALVLFTDAVSLDLREVRRHAGLGLLMLGPGTLLSAGLTALAGRVLLDLSLPAAVILGAALASTDPILLRGMLRSSGMSGGARLALRLESGMNDVSLLPVVIVAMPFLLPAGEFGPAELAKIVIDLFLLGPGAGVLVGLLSVAVLDLVRRRVGVRRDYESLYALGVAFTAFAAAEAVHGSGFLAAFAAGLTVSALDVELCDCFLEYGETTAEMTLLFAFVILGSALIWSGLGMISVATLAFAAVALFGRIPILYLALARTGLDRRGRLLIGWFGPKGLGSLLLVLLPIFAGIPGSAALFPIACLVVLISVVVHGGTPLFLRKQQIQRARRDGPGEPVQEPAPPLAAPAAGASGNSQPAPAIEPPGTLPAEAQDGMCAVGPGSVCALRSAEPAPAPRVNLAPPAPAPDAAPPDGPSLNAPAEDEEDARYYADRISLDQVQRLSVRGEPVILLDVRTERALGHSDRQARGAVRIDPEHSVAQARARELPRNAWLVAYCA